MKSILWPIGLVAVAVCCAEARAQSLKWTGEKDDNWNDPLNWSPMRLPTSADDVVIPFDPTREMIVSPAGAAARSITSGRNLLINGNMTVTGSMTSTGSVTVGASRTLTMQGTNPSITTARLRLDGTLSIAAGVRATLNGPSEVTTGFLVIPTNAVVFNRSGWTSVLLSESSRSGGVTGEGTFVNEGTMTGPQVTVLATFLNRGLIEAGYLSAMNMVNDGQITARDLALYGRIDLANLGTFVFVGQSSVSLRGTVTGRVPGSVQAPVALGNCTLDRVTVTGPVTVASHAVTSIVGQLDLENGLISISDGSTMQFVGPGHLKAYGAGVIQGVASERPRLRVTSAAQASIGAGVILSNPGTIVVDSGSCLQLLGRLKSDYLTGIVGCFQNLGTVQARFGMISFGTVPINLDTVTGTLTGGEWLVEGATTFIRFPSPAQIRTIGPGTRITNPSRFFGTTEPPLWVVERNQGDVRQEWPFSWTPAGGSFVNEGVLTLARTAPLMINGNFAQSPVGRLNIELDKPGATAVITSGGPATLAGRLNATVFAHVPAPSDPFYVIAAPSITGEFAGLTSEPPLTSIPVYGADFVNLVFRGCASPCNLADITTVGELGPLRCPDGQITVDDLLMYANALGSIDGCLSGQPLNSDCRILDLVGSNDQTPDGYVDMQDITAFIAAFTEGCP